jgi:uncharacterized protein (DUF1330 family)
VSEQPGIAPAGEPTTFEDCLQRVNPTAAALENLASQADETPMMMLNLLRFRPRGDATIYSMYGREAAPEVEKVGSFVGYFGMTLSDLDPGFGFDTSWDGLVLPVYHRRAAYLQLQRSSPYQLAIPYRSAGTLRRALYVLSDGQAFSKDASCISAMDESREGLSNSANTITVLDLMRFREASGRDAYRQYLQSAQALLQSVGAQVVLSAEAEVPVLSEAYWDHAVMIQFPSLGALCELYSSDAWKTLSAQRSEALAARLSIAARPIPLPS